MIYILLGIAMFILMVMTGSGKSKTEKLVLKLERMTMALESTIEAGQRDAAQTAMNEQLQVLQWLHNHGGWSEQQIDDYLTKRGLLRSLFDEKYRAELEDKSLAMNLG